MTNAQLIESINNIRTNDRAQKIRNGEKKPTNLKLQAVLIFIVTILVICVPAVIFSILVPDANHATMPIFSYLIIALLLGGLLLWRRQRILHFLKVKNAHTYFDRVTVKDSETIKHLVAKDALVITDDLDDKTLSLIYNWLKYRQMLRSDRVTIHTFTGEQLRHAVSKPIDILDYYEIHAISFADLNLDSPQKELFFRDIIACTGYLSTLAQ